MTQYLSTFLKDIVDTDIRTLIAELEQVTKVGREIFLDGPLIHYLQQCVRPNGSDTEQVLIGKNMLDSTDDFENAFLLRKQIKKLNHTQIYWLCDELARIYKKRSIEPDLGKTLYVFLNQCLKEVKKKKKKPVNYLWRTSTTLL